MAMIGVAGMADHHDCNQCRQEHAGAAATDLFHDVSRLTQVLSVRPWRPQSFWVKSTGCALMKIRRVALCRAGVTFCIC